MTLKDRIREARGSDSQATAGRKSGMSQQRWSQLEQGLSEETALLPAIADAYDLSLDWLTYGRGPKFRATGTVQAQSSSGAATFIPPPHPAHALLPVLEELHARLSPAGWRGLEDYLKATLRL